MIVLRFIERINAGDVEGLYALMAEDHTFIDSLGHTVTGREAMRTAWRNYYRMMLDYSIEVQDITQVDNLVAVFGQASGTYAVNGESSPDNHWSTPAAWKVIVHYEKIARCLEGDRPLREDRPLAGLCR